jgi:hypothetical protein
MSAKRTMKPMKILISDFSPSSQFAVLILGTRVELKRIAQ